MQNESTTGERDDTDLDADFALFQRRGDAAALARVFDRAAPRLLLLAAHFARDAAEAEDLVQTTFLHAVRDAATWQRERPVAAWLAGILRHRALDLVRARRRRPERELPDLPLAAAAADPADLAQQRDLFERVVAAADAIDEPFRAVLLMRLVHGLEPTAIAHTLGRAPGTVRMQLKRGLEKLRAALPSAEALLGGAFGAVVLGESARGLGAVRERVLRAASGAASVTTSAAILASWPAASVIGALALLAVWLVSTRPEAVPSPEPAAIVVASEPASKETAVVALLESTFATTRQPLPEPIVSGDDGVIVRGRIELEGGGDPSGVRLTWDAAMQVENEFGFTTSAPDPTQPAVREVFTSADGSFEIAAPKNRDIDIELRHDGFGTIAWSVIGGRFTSPLDLGTTVVPRAGVLVGQLVDVQGRPVARALPIHVLSRERYPPLAPSAVRFETTSDPSDGSFRIESIAPGEVSIDVRLPERSTVGRNRRFSVRREGETHVELVVEDEGGPPSAALQFTVTPQTIGVRPAPGSIRLIDAEGHSHIARAGTQNDNFEFRGLTPQEYELVVRDEDWKVRTQTVVFPFDSGKLLSLMPARRLQFVVRAAGTGSPVAPSKVCFEYHAPDVQVFGGQPPTYADARLTSTVTAQTTSDPQTWTFEAPGFATREVRFDEGIDFTSQSIVHVDLEPAAPLTARFEDSDGAPLADAWIHARLADHPTARTWRVKSDANGRFTFDALTRGTYDVWGALHSNAVVHERMESGGDEELALVAPPCGAVELTFGTEWKHLGHTLDYVFERADESQLERAHRASLASSGWDHEKVHHGRVRRDRLPEGTYRVGVRLRNPFIAPSDNGEPRPDIEAPLVELCTVEVHAHETTVVDIDAQLAAPPRLAVAVALSGDTSVPVVALARLRGTSAVVHGAAMSRVNGSATIEWIAPGAYDVELRDADGTWSVRVDGPAVVEAGATTHIARTIELATATLRLVDASGSPLALAHVELSGANSGPDWSRTLDTGRLGLVRLTLPVGTWRLTLLGDDGAPTGRAIDFEWTASGVANGLLVLPD